MLKLGGKTFYKVFTIVPFFEDIFSFIKEKSALGNCSFFACGGRSPAAEGGNKQMCCNVR